MTPILTSRLRQLRAIRHKAGELLDDVSYREILQRCAGVSSSTQIRSVAKAEAVIDEFRRLGIGTPPPRKPLTPQQKKIWSLWQSLADKGHVTDRTMRGLLVWVKRQTGVDALSFMTWPQERQVTESLKRWLARGVDDTVNGKKQSKTENDHG